MATQEGTKFGWLFAFDDALAADALGRWANGNYRGATAAGNHLYLGGTGCLRNAPNVLRNVRLDRFRATFQAKRIALQCYSPVSARGTTNTAIHNPQSAIRNGLRAKPALCLYHATTGNAPVGGEILDGNAWARACPP